MNKDIAVVHWTDKGIDKLASVGTIQLLSQMIEYCEKNGFTYYVCLTSLDTIIPVRPQEPVTATLTIGEYDSKVEIPNPQQKPFWEVTRIDPIHHPPLDHHAHAEKVRKIYRDVQGY